VAIKLRVITNSEIGCHRTCARKHWYRYEKLLRLRSASEDKALTDGRQAHDYQEQWWQGGDIGSEVAVESALEAIQDPLVKTLMVGYDARWSDDTTWETVAVEQELYLPFIKVGGVRLVLGTKLDGIVRHSVTGEFYVREFKTTAYDVTPGSFYWQSIRLNTQIDTYCHVLREHGTEVKGTLYDVAHKPRLRPERALPPEKVKWTKPKPATKTKPAEPSRPYANQRVVDETEAEFTARVALTIGNDPEKFYARSIIMRTEQQVDDFTEELEYYAARMMNAPPYRNTDACIKFNRLCEYHPLCAGYGREEDYTRAESRHSELEKANETEESGEVGRP
jgi:hypothetical protein